MRSEPQNIGPAFDVLTPKLSCLIQFDRLIFQTNVVERVNSGKNSLVVTCTADCTYNHHLTYLKEKQKLRSEPQNIVSDSI